MDLNMPCPGAHSPLGKEVVGMDDVSYDVDVHVCCVSINKTSDREERMSNHD